MIKRKIFSLILLPIGIMLTSCQNEELLMDKSEAPFQITDSNFIPIDEALANAEKMFGRIGVKSTRNSGRIKSIERFKNSTRSDISSTHGLYIVNYENECGFALISADRRLSPVYALSEEGSLSLADTMSNPGLNWYINVVLPSLMNDIVAPIDTTALPIFPIEKPWSYYEKYSDPLLKGFMAKFHQDEPYNNYIQEINNNHCPVGCLPLAIGTVVGYYEWPQTIDNYVFPWDEIKMWNWHPRWLRLFELLGRPEYTNAKYNLDKTTAPFENLISSFNKLGYEGAKIAKVDFSVIASELKAGHPIIVEGFYSDTAHAWIIDGGYVEGYENMIEQPDLPKHQRVIETFMHCVWGWKGQSNGYYLTHIDRDQSGHIGGIPETMDNPEDPYPQVYYNMMMCYGYRTKK